MISKVSEKPDCHLWINDDQIEEAENFNYLGSLSTTDMGSKKS